MTDLELYRQICQLVREHVAPDHGPCNTICTYARELRFGIGRVWDGGPLTPDTRQQIIQGAIRHRDTVLASAAPWPIPGTRHTTPRPQFTAGQQVALVEIPHQHSRSEWLALAPEHAQTGEISREWIENNGYFGGYRWIGHGLATVDRPEPGAWGGCWRVWRPGTGPKR